MITEKMHQKIRSSVKLLQSYTDRFWYPPLIGLLAALDNLVLIIPNDGILISSSMIIPKRWITLAFCVAIGSTFGAIVLSLLVEFQGLPWILEFYPNIEDSKTWAYSVDLFENYGLFLVFAVAVTPLMQQPAVILASVAHTPLIYLAAVIFAGRLIKFLIMAYIGSHAPKMLNKLWGLKGELKDVGLKTPD